MVMKEGFKRLEENKSQTKGAVERYLIDIPAEPDFVN